MTNKCRRKRDNIELKVQYFSDCRGDLASGPFLSRLLLCFGDLSPWLGPPPPNRGSSILPAFGIAVRIPCYKTLRLNLRVFFKIFPCIFFNHSFFLSGVSHQTWDLSKNLHNRRFQGKKFTQKMRNFRHLLNRNKKCVNALNWDKTSKKCSVTM